MTPTPRTLRPEPCLRSLHFVRETSSGKPVPRAPRPVPRICQVFHNFLPPLPVNYVGLKFAVLFIQNE